jgi:Rap1a immunity proteins
LLIRLGSIRSTSVQASLLKRGEGTMRTKVLAASAMVALWPLQVGAQDAGVADTGDFAVETGQDLLDLCSVDASNSLHAEALQFCAGFLEGMKHYHDRMSAGPDVEPIVCAPSNVTVEDAIDTYVAYARANPQFLNEDPADNVIRAAMATWPCS